MSPADGDAGLKGNAKVTREDWIAAALDLLIAEGVDRVKVLTLSDRLHVARSSFYWHFADRKALLQALLDTWEAKNTRSFRAACAEDAPSVTAALCNLFKCFVDDRLFDPRLDFAVRAWARRSADVRRAVDASDADRVAAVAAMFERHGYAPTDALVRGRIVYFMQIGYYALEVSEPLEARLAVVPEYLAAFSGRAPDEAAVATLADYARAAADISPEGAPS